MASFTYADFAMWAKILGDDIEKSRKLYYMFCRNKKMLDTGILKCIFVDKIKDKNSSNNNI